MSRPGPPIPLVGNALPTLLIDSPWPKIDNHPPQLRLVCSSCPRDFGIKENSHAKYAPALRNCCFLPAAALVLRGIGQVSSYHCRLAAGSSDKHFGGFGTGCRERSERSAHPGLAQAP